MTDSKSSAGARHYPLQGVRVLDLTHIYNGPYATFLMAMAGAEVVKLEPPTGEHLRHRAESTGAEVPFAMLNANKRSVTLDFKSDRGRKLLRAMATKADVFVENFAPGVLDRNGIGYENLSAVNSTLIYASATGYGLSGPYRDYPAMDLTVQAMSGVIATTGFPEGLPVKAGPAVADFFGGVHLYGAIVTALFDRERTGAGRLVEISMQESTYASLSSSIGQYFKNPASPPPRTGNSHSGFAEAPYNVYPALDGYVAVVGNHDAHFQRLLRIMGREDLAEDPRFVGLAARASNIEAVDDLVSNWTRTRKKSEVAAQLIAARIPSAPVREISEVVNDEHMHARGALEWIDHPRYGRIAVQRSPMRFSGTDPIPLEPSADLGADNDEVYADWLGLDEDKLRSLREAGVI